MPTFKWNVGCKPCGGICENCVEAISAIEVAGEFVCDPFSSPRRIPFNFVFDPWSSGEGLFGSPFVGLGYPEVTNSDFCNDQSVVDPFVCSSSPFTFITLWLLIRITATHMLIVLFIDDGSFFGASYSGTAVIPSGDCLSLDGEIVSLEGGPFIDPIPVTLAVS